MSGCATCVYDLYLEDVELFHAEALERRARVLDALRRGEGGAAGGPVGDGEGEGEVREPSGWDDAVDVLGPWADAVRDLAAASAAGAAGEQGAAARADEARDKAERELKRARDALDPGMRCVALSLPFPLLSRASLTPARPPARPQRLPRDGGPHQGQAARAGAPGIACARLTLALVEPAAAVMSSLSGAPWTRTRRRKRLEGALQRAASLAWLLLDSTRLDSTRPARRRHQRPPALASTLSYNTTRATTTTTRRTLRAGAACAPCRGGSRPWRPTGRGLLEGARGREEAREARVGGGGGGGGRRGRVSVDARVEPRAARPASEELERERERESGTHR